MNEFECCIVCHVPFFFIFFKIQLKFPISKSTKYLLVVLQLDLFIIQKQCTVVPGIVVLWYDFFAFLCR